MSAPSAIPRPIRLRLRDLAHRGGPLLAVALAIAVVGFLWRADLFPSSFVGEAQGPTSTLTSPNLGRLEPLQVRLYDVVTNGQILGRVATRSEDAMKATLAAARADLEILHLRMLQDQERNDLNYEDLLDRSLLARLELASARIRLRQAESEFERAKLLFEQKILSAGVGIDQDGYDVALRDRDLLRAEVADKEEQVKSLQASLQALRPTGETGFKDRARAAIDASVAAQEALLRETEGPSVLRAPIDGMVMRIYRQAGEVVAENEPLFEIRAVRPEWILGFIRQPISGEPQVGDKIRVRSRGRPLQEGAATVLKVGAHLELFSQPLRVRGFDASQERGLPVLLSFPENLRLHPGELVDLEPITRR